MAISFNLNIFIRKFFVDLFYEFDTFNILNKQNNFFLHGWMNPFKIAPGITKFLVISFQTRVVFFCYLFAFNFKTLEERI